MPPVRSARLVVADSVRARFFSLHPQNDPHTEGRRYMALHTADAGAVVMTEAEALVAEPGRSNPAVRHDMGRSFESASVARHIIAPHTDDKTLDQTAFARRIVARLQQEQADGVFERLILIAPEQMLGILRQHLPDPIRATVIHDEAAEWTGLSVPTLQRRIQDVLE